MSWKWLTIPYNKNEWDFVAFPFQVSSPMCSDSKPVVKADVDDKTIRWQFDSIHGVRTGLELRTKDDVAPEMGNSSKARLSLFSP